MQPWQVDGRFHAISQLIDNFQVSQADLCQLRLTEHELEQFQSHKPLASYCMHVSGRMPTALHSWGSQVYSCPCGCRGPFTEARLAKGISAVVVPFAEQGAGIAFRHLHPRELALLNGYNPEADFGDSLRLSLALIGQLASPLQSAWVLSQLKGFLLGGHDRYKLAVLHLTQQRQLLVRQAERLGMLSSANAGRAVESLQEALRVLQVQPQAGLSLPNPCLLPDSVSPRTPRTDLHMRTAPAAGECSKAKEAVELGPCQAEVAGGQVQSVDCGRVMPGPEIPVMPHCQGDPSRRTVPPVGGSHLALSVVLPVLCAAAEAVRADGPSPSP